MQTSELEQNKHAVLPEPNHDELARQQFVRSFKEHLVAQVHPGNRLAYENRVKPAFAKEHGREPESRFEIRDVMTRDSHYRMFSALLRTSQEMMWSALQHPVQRKLGELVEKAKVPGATGGSLRLDPALEIPRYHQAVDIHCQPGGYHTEVTEDDVAPGAIYDRAVFIYAMGQMGPDNADMGGSTVAWIKENYPDINPARILDMGCAVGHISECHRLLRPGGLMIHAETPPYKNLEPMSEQPQLKRKAKGERPYFFPDPSIDKLLAMLMGLAGMQDDDEAPYSQALELVTGVND